MKKSEIVLAALATSHGASFSPVQIQKFLFLLDRNLADHLGGPFFEFVPYDYGPFDKSIYDVLDSLVAKDLVETATPPGSRYQIYYTTPAGHKIGVGLLRKMPTAASNFIKEVSIFVRKLSFSQLIRAIYRDYPDMKINSVFN